MVPDLSLRYRSLLADFFTSTAQMYDSWAHEANVKAAVRLAEVAAVQRGEQVADIGCGTGRATAIMAAAAELPARVMGVDLSQGMLDVARDGTPGPAFFTQMDAEQLAFGNENLDVITMGQLLPYLVHPMRGLSEAFRVLRPEGRIVVANRRRSLGTPAQELFFSLLRTLEESHPIDVPHLSADRAAYGEPQILGKILEDAGFAHVRFHQLITGVTASTITEWVDIMSLLGPYPYILISSLGPRRRAEFEELVAAQAARLEEETLSMHLAYTFAVADRLDRHPAGHGSEGA